MRYVYVALLGSLLAACAGSAGSPSATNLSPPSPVQFACPAGGTVTRTSFTDGHTSQATWQGADGSDPTTCLALVNGQAQRYVFGLTQLPLASGEADERRILAQVFAGSGQKQCYEQKSAVGGSGAGYFFGEECWKQLGSGLIDVDGKPVSVVAISRSYDGLAGNAYAGDWTFYYDPSTHLIVKADTVNRRGAILPGWTRAIIG